MRLFESEFDIGDLIYLKHDPEQIQRMIVAITFDQYGEVYSIASGQEISQHSPMEISKEQNELMIMGVFKTRN